MARTREAVLEECIEQDVAMREKVEVIYWWQMSTKLGMAEVLSGGSHAKGV
jgi:hypothetical protein